jgi:lipopolysaccharide export system permease protein
VSLLDRYLTREILLPFGAGLVFLTQLLLATALLARADVLFGSGVSLLDVGVVVLALLPHFLGFVLPIAFLLGAVLGVARLAEDREVVALGAAGVSPLRLVRVPLALALVAGALGVANALWVEPFTLAVGRLRLNEIIKKNVQSDVRAGTFFDRIPGFTLYAEKVEGGGWSNVLLHDRSTPETPVLALASRGRLEPVGAGEEMRLVLEAGELHREDVATDDYVVAGFATGTLSLGLGTALTDRNALRAGSNEVPLADAIEAARPGPGRRPEDVRRAAAGLQRRISAPLSVVPFALLAVALGASRRAGRAFGVGATILAVLAHYLLLRAAEVLASRGALPAVLALQLPTIVLGAVGVALLAGLARRGPGAVR